MREIKGEMAGLMRDAVHLGNREDYMRVVLTDMDEIIDPMGKLRSVYPHIMSLDFENSRRGIDLDVVAADMESVEKLSAYELFGEFFLDMQGSVMNAEQAEIVRALLEGPGEE
jgi:exonuclease SbcD